MGSNHTYNPYCCLLPSQRAIAVACWRLGVQPDFDTWVVVLQEAAVIEESSHPPHDNLPQPWFWSRPDQGRRASNEPHEHRAKV